MAGPTFSRALRERARPTAVAPFLLLTGCETRLVDARPASVELVNGDLVMFALAPFVLGAGLLMLGLTVSRWRDGERDLRTLGASLVALVCGLLVPSGTALRVDLESATIERQSTWYGMTLHSETIGLDGARAVALERERCTYEWGWRLRDPARPVACGFVGFELATGNRIGLSLRRSAEDGATLLVDATGLPLHEAR